MEDLKPAVADRSDADRRSVAGSAADARSPLETGGLADPRSFEPELAQAGPLGAAYAELWHALWSQAALPPGVLKLCLERMATLHGLAPVRSAARTAAEEAALEFTEVYAQDPAALTDELAQAVKLHFGDKGLVALVEALGFCDARLRLARLLPQLATGATP